MKNMTRRVVASLLAAAVVLSLSACGSTETGSEPEGQTTEPIKVGAVLSLTGTYAALGTSEKQALDMQVKAVNDAGGIDGRQIELIIEDDGTDEAKAVAAASKLIAQDGVVAILGATGTGQSMAVRNEIQRAGVPQISMAGGTVITEEFDRLVYQTPWSNKIVVPFVLDAIKAAGHTKIAVMSDTGGYGKDGKAVIEAEAEKAGITIVSNQTFNPGDTDFTAQLTKAKSSEAQALLLWTAGKEGASIVKSVDSLGMKLPLFGGSGQARTEFIEGAGPAAEGMVIGTGKNFVRPEGQSTALDEFISAYEKEYGEAPDIFAGHAYDALLIFVDAVKRSGSTVPEELNKALESTTALDGFAGAFTFSETDHNGLTENDLGLFTVTDATWQAAK